jgi:hypothetical protein
MPQTHEVLALSRQFAVIVALGAAAACGGGATDTGPRGNAAANGGSGPTASTMTMTTGSGAAGGGDGSNPLTLPPTPTVGNKLGSDGSGTCDVVQLVAKPVIPEMMIVLDRSGSMADKRWKPSVSAVRSLTTSLQARIHFGLALFPDPSVGNDSQSVVDITSCLSDPDPQSCLDKATMNIGSSACAPGKIMVPVADNNAGPIGDVLDTTQPGGGTPTSDTLQRIVTDYAGAPPAPDAPPTAKYVLLVTDGAPTCPAGDGSATTQPDIDASNAAIEALAAKGVKTYVIGYDTTGSGNEMLASVLDGFAQRGGTGDKMHRPVEDEQSLLTEFNRIAGAIASCRFQLNAPPQRADYVLVRLDGKQVNLNQPDGFMLVDDRTVELEGAACTTFQQGNHILDAQVQCSVVQPM